jgi:hypothetical protein
MYESNILIEVTGTLLAFLVIVFVIPTLLLLIWREIKAGYRYFKNRTAEGLRLNKRSVVTARISNRIPCKYNAGFYIKDCPGSVDGGCERCGVVRLDPSGKAGGWPYGF